MKFDTAIVFLIGLLGLALINDMAIVAILLAVVVVCLLAVEAANIFFNDLDDMEK